MIIFVRNKKHSYLAHVSMVFVRNAVAAVTFEILQCAKLSLQQLLQLQSIITLS